MRLWSGLYEGVAREVRICADDGGGFWFEVASDGSESQIPVSPSQLRGILHGEAIEVANSPTGAILSLAGGSIDFDFDSAGIRFAMPASQFGALLASLGLPPLK